MIRAAAAAATATATRAGTALALLGALGGLPAAGCGEGSTALFDSYPIALVRAPIGGGVAGDGALRAKASLPGGPPFDMVVDTGSPITVLNGPAAGELQTIKAGFDIFDANSTLSSPPLRARFRGLDLLRLPLQPIGDGSILPGAVLGGDLLRGYSVQMRFGAPCPMGAPPPCSYMTFWTHVGADESFLEDAGYAVYRFSLYGGGQVTAEGDPDFLGARGPLVLVPTRVSLRTCAVPTTFAPSDEIPACCKPPDAAALATGVNLSLLLATGVGPLILSQSAFDRLAATTALPPLTDPSASLFVATWPVTILARWSTIPRLAFVDLEEGAANDPGACVELGRARRTEQVSYRRVRAPETNVCGQPCDADTREPALAQSSAAYLELGGQIPVAVVSDTEAFLQALRFDVRPEGPELDGLVGAGALGRARIEIDYLSSQPRALFSCEPDASRDECWAAARCPRLPDQESRHICFQLPVHGLPPACAADPRCP